MRKVFVALLFLALSVLGIAQMGVTSGADDPKALPKAEREYNSAKKVFKLHPTAANRQRCVVATDRYALTSMTSGSLQPKVKYRQALRLYREALKIDPKNPEAKNNSDLIISIYKSMHRPVPQ